LKFSQGIVEITFASDIVTATHVTGKIISGN